MFTPLRSTGIFTNLLLQRLPQGPKAMRQNSDSPRLQPRIRQLSKILSAFPFVHQAILFGSMASASDDFNSDLDLAVATTGALLPEQKDAIIKALTLAFDCPIDLIDLKSAGQPLLDNIIQHGIQIRGSSSQWADLMYRNILEQEDFVPYQRRILAGRLASWMNS